MKRIAVWNLTLRQAVVIAGRPGYLAKLVSVAKLTADFQPIGGFR